MLTVVTLSSSSDGLSLALLRPQSVKSLEELCKNRKKCNRDCCEQ